MRKFGLIGYPLGHSFSKAYFSEKFSTENLSDCVYENFPLESIDRLPEMLDAEPDLEGFNITIPYKQQILPYLSEVDAEAAQIGAVNTVKIIRSGEKISLKGFNTDAYGFEQPLIEHLQPSHKKALILGTGGASKAVAFILQKHNINYRYVSRTPKTAEILPYEQVNEELIGNYHIIVNCSPLGMHPDINTCPDIPYHSIGEGHILYDLVYNPRITLFLQKGAQKKAITINGLPMLHLQAEKSWEIWNA